MSGAEADRWAWLLVLSFVFGCNVLRILLPSFSSFMSRLLQKDAEQEAQMRAEIQDMKQELSTVNMMDEFARYARLERKINKMTDKLKTHVKARTAQLAKIKWVISVAFYVLQAALMVSLIWKYYSVPVAVVPSKWITPLDRLVAFPTRVAGKRNNAACRTHPCHSAFGCDLLLEFTLKASTELTAARGEDARLAGDLATRGSSWQGRREGHSLVSVFRSSRAGLVVFKDIARPKEFFH
ncbi:hypothetical protein GH733_016169 [Mirounga leonina]|nr:hypothetical protein GH733_016169 [Mirounga leonina]